MRSVRTCHTCNFQDMYEWKTARPTISRKAGYAPDFGSPIWNSQILGILTLTVKFSLKETKAALKGQYYFVQCIKGVFAHFSTTPDNFIRFPKTTDEVRRLLKTSEELSKHLTLFYAKTINIKTLNPIQTLSTRDRSSYFEIFKILKLPKMLKPSKNLNTNLQGPVVQKVDNAFHRINLN